MEMSPFALFRIQENIGLKVAGLRVGLLPRDQIHCRFHGPLGPVLMPAGGKPCGGRLHTKVIPV
jgi:hypothetical protein